MKKMKLTPSILIVFVLVLAMLVGNAYAKYAAQEQVEGSVSITAQLGTINLWEHEAELQSNGSYTLNAGSLVSCNSYVLIPGVDIPKDTYVEITNKTPIPVYVYVEIVSSSAISYAVDTSNWTKVADTGAKGGTVYVYKDSVTANITGINIFAGQKILVSQNLGSDAPKFAIYASMYQTASGSDAADVYSKNKDSNN